MSDKSDIEWTDATWNPVRGCTKISPGCKHCYAETFAERWRGIPGHAYEEGFDPRLVPEKLDQPLRWKKPRTIFVNSMSDLFHERFHFGYIAAAFGVMAASPQHRFQVLTKRAEGMRDFFAWLAFQPRILPYETDAALCVRAAECHFPTPGASDVWPLPNVWMGVSVEDRRYGLPRIDLLRQVPAAVRFLSIEPLLEDLGKIDLTGIGWVIVGGESGHGARACNIEWIRSIAKQCRSAGVPLFVKQLGAFPTRNARIARPDDPWSGPLMLTDRKGGDASEWPEDLRVREMPSQASGSAR